MGDLGSGQEVDRQKGKGKQPEKANFGDWGCTNK